MGCVIRKSVVLFNIKVVLKGENFRDDFVLVFMFNCGLCLLCLMFCIVLFLFWGVNWVVGVNLYDIFYGYCNVVLSLIVEFSGCKFIDICVINGYWIGVVCVIFCIVIVYYVCLLVLYFVIL